jgi:hypothetical protein
MGANVSIKRINSAEVKQCFTTVESDCEESHYVKYPGERENIIARSSINKDDDDFGWFEDLGVHQVIGLENDYPTMWNQNNVGMTTSKSIPISLTCAPVYVLESSLSSQHLWYQTAGQRPQQPNMLRKKFEEIWSENFATSSALLSVTSIDESTKNIKNDKIIFRGDALQSEAVSKAFNHINSLTTITLEVI